MPLYPQQKVIADFIETRLAIDHPLIANTQYLAGEMGVGKTYIASELLTRQNTTDPGLIICPKEVFKKWQKVLATFTDKKIVGFTPKSDLDGDIYVVTYQNMTKFANAFTAYQEKINSTSDAFSMVIIDEAHLLKRTQKAFDLIDNIITIQQNAHRPSLLLTGTIFNQRIKDLFYLLKMTHPTLLNTVDNDNANDFASDYESNIIKFMMDIWQYIAVQLSLKDIERDPGSDNVVQTIEPITYVKLSDLESQFYNVQKRRYINDLNLNANSSLNRIADSIDSISTELTDYTSRKTHWYDNIHVAEALGTFAFKNNKDEGLELLNHNGYVGSNHSNFNIVVKHHQHSQQNLIAPGIMKQPLKDASKFKALLNILKQTTCTKSLIFANSASLITSMVKELNRQGFKAQKLPNNLDAADRGEYINHALSTKDCDIFIVNPQQIKVGVDIDQAENVIWYEILANPATVLQAQRRVYRLSSTKNSHVYYMAYESTEQAHQIELLAQNAKNNAATVGVRADDELTGIVGKLFAQLDITDEEAGDDSATN